MHFLALRLGVAIGVAGPAAKRKRSTSGKGGIEQVLQLREVSPAPDIPLSHFLRQLALRQLIR